jgi:phosphoglycolate phosphatase-like HAD superfamily hydrolase
MPDRHDLRLPEDFAIAFDCDGVLVDTKNSYEIAAVRTITELLSQRYGNLYGIGSLVERLLFRLRLTGEYNNDWDSTYAIAVIASIALSENEQEPLIPERGRVQRRIRELTEAFISSGYSIFDGGMRRFIHSLRDAGLRDSVLKFENSLEYPTEYGDSKLARTFDAYYYGDSFYSEIHGKDRGGRRDVGLINRERNVFDGITAAKLRAISKERMAIITGRPLLSVARVLDSSMEFFDMEASVFLGDFDISDGELLKYRKPNPDALLRCMRHFDVRALLYCGNGVEDMQMVKKAKMLDSGFMFAGICGYSPFPDELAEYFRGENAEIIASNLEELVSLLETASER